MEYAAEVQRAGRVTVPLEIRKALNIEEGDKVTFRHENGEIKLVTQKQRLDEAYALLRSYIPASTSLVDELIQERREEAAREEREYLESVTRK